MEIQLSRPATLAVAENIRKSDITAFYNDFRRSLLPALRDKLKDCRGHLDECAQIVISDESVRPFLKRIDTAGREFRTATKKLADHALRARIFAQEIQHELERLSSNHDDDDNNDDDGDGTMTALDPIGLSNGSLTLSRSDTDLSTSGTLTPSHSDTDLSTPSTSASASAITLVRRPALSSDPADPTINVRHYLHELARTASRYYLESSHLPAAYTSLENTLLTTRATLKQRHSELHASLPSIQRHIPALERRETVHTLMDYFRQGVQSAIPYASNAIGQARELAHARGVVTAEHEITYARLDSTLSDVGQVLSVSAPSTPSTPALQVKHAAHRTKVDVTNLASLVAMLDIVAADMRTVAGHIGIFARFWEETERGVKRCIELSELVVTGDDWFAMLGGMVNQWGDLEGGLGEFARAVRI